MSPPIYTPDGSEVSEIVLPDGSTASEVIGPDGNVVFEAGGDIPDSAIQYLTEDFTASNWPDSAGSQDMSTINGLSENSTAFGGNGGVFGDGSDDYGESQPIDSVITYHDDWAVAFGFSSSDSGALAGANAASGSEFDNFFQINSNSATISGIGIQRAAAGTVQRIESGTGPLDGGEYVVIIQSNGPQASDVGIYFDPSTDTSAVNTDQGNLSSPTAGLENMAYYARKDSDGYIGNNMNLGLTNIRWYNRSLTESERGAIFDSFDWYDPATDAPI